MPTETPSISSLAISLGSGLVGFLGSQLVDYWKSERKKKRLRLGAVKSMHRGILGHISLVNTIEAEIVSNEFAGRASTGARYFEAILQVVPEPFIENDELFAALLDCELRMKNLEAQFGPIVAQTIRLALEEDPPSEVVELKDALITSVRDGLVKDRRALENARLLVERMLRELHPHACGCCETADQPIPL